MPFFARHRVLVLTCGWLVVLVGLLMVRSALAAPVPSGPVAHAAAGDSIGTPPPPGGIDESRCAPMQLSAHIIEVGQDVFGAAEPAGKDACGGDISGQAPTWSWDDFAGLTPDHCRDNTAGCKFRATSPTGYRDDRYVTGCINGSSFQGPWDSCDYYAVVPRCAGDPMLTLKHERSGQETIVEFEGHDWDTQDCGPVTITASQQAGVVATENGSNFHGEMTLRGHRVCGVSLTATQAPPNRKAVATWSDGYADGVVVVLAEPGSTPDGDPLQPGDQICKSDLPAGVSPRSMGEKQVAEVATNLGQTLLELYIPRASANYELADPSGRIGVVGQSIEHAHGGLLSDVDDALISDPSTQTFTTTSIGEISTPSGDVSLTGPVILNAGGGTLTITGNLTLADADVLVQGNLVVDGTITGRGTIYTDGGLSAAGVSLWGYDNPWQFGVRKQFGLVAGGAFELP